MNHHGLWMIIGCTLPLLLIFLLPVFGVRSDVSLFAFIILMFACHLLMMGGHHGKHAKHSNKEEGKHGCH